MQDWESKIKQTLLDAEEEVPSRVWDSVSARLDKLAPKPAVPLWRRIAVYAIPAAAAVLLGVFLSVPQHEEAPVFDKIVSEEVPSAVVAETSATSDVPSPVPSAPRAVRPSAVPSASSVSDGDRIAAPAAVTEDAPAVKAAPEAAPAEAVRGEDVAPRDSRTDRPAASDAVDNEAAFNALAFEQMQGDREGGFSYSLGGDIQTNGNPSSRNNRYYRASAQPQTGISEGETLHYGIPVSFGIGVRYRFAPKFSVGTGLVYTNLSRTFTGRYIEIEQGREVRSFTGDFLNVQHYLGVPLNFYWHFVDGKDIRCYAFAGGMIERCLSDSYRLPSADNFIWSKAPRGVQLSASAGLGVEFGLTDHLGIYVDPSLHYWFNNRQSKSIRTQQPLMMGLEVGLRFGW